MNLNVVHLVGRVGGEPEIKYFESGKILCTFTLAVNRPTRNKETDWFNVNCWGKTAEIAKDYAKKGSQVAIQGSLQLERWVDSQTQAKRSRPVVQVDKLDLLGSKRENSGGGEMPNYSPADFM